MQMIKKMCWNFMAVAKLRIGDFQTKLHIVRWCRVKWNLIHVQMQYYTSETLMPSILCCAQHATRLFMLVALSSLNGILQNVVRHRIIRPNKQKRYRTYEVWKVISWTLIASFSLILPLDPFEWRRFNVDGKWWFDYAHWIWLYHPMDISTEHEALSIRKMWPAIRYSIRCNRSFQTESCNEFGPMSNLWLSNSIGSFC